MWRALIWDVDGTLAETERDGHLVAFNQAFAAMGLPWRWDDECYARLLEVTGGRERLLFDMASRADTPSSAAEREALAAELHRLKNARYADVVAQGAISLRPGVRELLDDCAQAGLPMAVATTTSRVNLQALMVATLGVHWQHRFAATLCAEDAPRKKPDPQIYQRALAALGMDAGDALAIEDAPAGVIAARAAGVPVIVTRSHYFAAAEVRAAQAVGPGLHCAAGWSPAPPPLPPHAAENGRISLATLQAWAPALRGIEFRGTIEG